MRNHIFFFVFVGFFLTNALPAQEITKPEIIKFGETKSKMMMALNDACKIVNDKKIEPTKLPTAQKTQSQVDCARFQYFGKKRDAEFVFADGILDEVWILTDSTERDTLIAGFTKLYGKPTHVKNDATFFLNDGVAVRSKPHEVLFISDRLKAPYKAWLEKNGK